MARNVDLVTLRTRVRDRSDTENETQRFTDARINDYVNEGIAQFHARVLRARGQGFAEVSTFITTSIGVEIYALPAQLLELVKVYTKIDGVERVLETYEEFDTNYMSDPGSWGLYRDPSHYRIIGDNISLRPTPSEVRIVNIKYIATAVKLVADSNTVDGIDGFEEFIVAWAAQRAAIKNRDWELKGTLDADIAAQIDQIEAVQPARNAAQAPRMQDVKPLGWGNRTYRRRIY